MGTTFLDGLVYVKSSSEEFHRNLCLCSMILLLDFINWFKDELVRAVCIFEVEVT